MVFFLLDEGATLYRIIVSRIDIDKTAAQYQWLLLTYSFFSAYVTSGQSNKYTCSNAMRLVSTTASLYRNFVHIYSCKFSLF